MTSKQPRRMDGYIRVSRVGDRDTESESYITEAVQREKIEQWAKLRGVEIVAWHVDRDQSGSNLSRPGFNAAMERIKNGETEGIVVAAIDRLSRADVADALMIVRQIHDEYGGTLAAVDLGVDPTTEVGEMLLTVLLALARMQWRRYRAAWETAKERARKRGVLIARTPVGYRRGADGKLYPHELEGPAIQRVFAEAAKHGLRRAVALAEELLLGTRDWTTVNVRRILTNRVYLGEIPGNKNAHEPLVDLATWTAAAKRVNERLNPSAPDAHYPLSHVAVCGACGAAMVGHRGSNKHVRAYRCSRNKSRAVRRGEAPRCPEPPVVKADELEEYVRAELVRYVAENCPDEEIVVVQGNGAEELQRAEAALKSAEIAYEADATDLQLRAVLGDEMWTRRMQAHAEKVDQLRAELEKLAVEAHGDVTWPLADEIIAAPADELPGLLERAGVRVTVTRGDGLPSRVRLAPAEQDQPEHADDAAIVG